MRKAAAWSLLVALLIAGAPAWAEMTPQDVRGQLEAMLAERRFENDRRLEAIEKEIVAASALINQRIDGNVKGFDIKTEALKEAMAIATATAKTELVDAREARSQALALQFGALKEAITKSETSSKEAVDKASGANEKRFESVNEFRAQQKDFQALLMPRAEAEVKMKASADSIAILSARLDQISGRSQGIEALWSIVAGALGLLIGGAGVALRFRQREERAA